MVIKLAAHFAITEQGEGVKVTQVFIRGIDNPEFTKEFKTLHEFIDYLSKGSYTVFFMDLSHAGEFIVSYLLKHGYSFNDHPKKSKQFYFRISVDTIYYTGAIHFKRYAKRIIKTEFRNLSRKMPFKLEELYKMFELPYEPDSLAQHTAVIARAARLSETYGTKTTIGNDCLSMYKAMIGDKVYRRLFPSMTYELDQFCREAYRGGVSYLMPNYQGQILNNVASYDKNSKYPFMLKSHPMPTGMPIVYTGRPPTNPAFLFIHRMRAVIKLKPGHLPTVQLKNAARYDASEYIYDTKGEQITLTLCSPDYELLFDNYEVTEIEHVKGLAFTGRTGLFDEYVDHWYSIKKSAPNNEIYTIAKLYLNNLYGVFGKKLKRTSKIPFLNGSKVVGYRYTKPQVLRGNYTPLAAFVTAYGRAEMIRDAEKMGAAFVYCDTDSIKLMEDKLPKPINELIKVSPTEIGAYKFEGVSEQWKGLRAKCYMSYSQGEYSVTCAGMDDRNKRSIKSFDDFHFGAQFVEGLEKSRVDGGVKYIKKIFTICA